MPRIFISYRREDSAGHAGRLHDELQRRFGGRDVFMDVSIPPGMDWEDHIRSVLASCDVLLAVIGRKWSTCVDGQGRRRLEDQHDLLRNEIRIALDAGKRVIPVLVDGARLPAAELPDDLRPLSRRQALELRDTRWHADVQDLIDKLAGIGPTPDPVPPRRGRRKVAWLIGAAAAGVALLALAYVKTVQPPQRTAELPSPAADVARGGSPDVGPPSPTPAASPTAILVADVPAAVSCVQRWSRPAEAGVACRDGEVLVSGGCTCPGGELVSSYPSGSDGGPASAWQCDGRCGELKAVGLCCAAGRVAGN